MKVFALLLPLCLSGCYYLKQGAGQLDVLLSSRSIDEAAADPALPEAGRRKLALIKEVKAFGEREMGLTPSSNYTTYYDTGGQPITWIVTACARDKFEPYTWSFPIVGTVPYKGFFDRADALAEARGLEALDLDVNVSPAAAYSTLGYFKDPVLSTMLAYSDEDLASLILHELTHGTIFLAGGVDFNEGLANFVGAQGAMEFFRGRRGEGSTSYARAVRSLAREERRDARSLATYRALDALYKSEASREDKLLLREEVVAALRAGWKAEADVLARDVGRTSEADAALERRVRWGGCPVPWSGNDVRRSLERLAALPGVAEGPVNNAVILAQRRYGRYDEFRAVFERVGGDWPAFFKAMKAGAP
ncbi:MAG TPA: aminopeptidase [Planctomycetota bacterium]